MDDVSETDTPEPFSVGPPAPQELPTNKPSLQDVLFGNDCDRKYGYDDQDSLASLDDVVPLPEAMPVEPPQEISTDKQDLISMSEDTFYEDRSLEARIHRSLMQGPTSGAVAKTTAKRLIQLPNAGISREAKLERTLEQTQQKLLESQDRVLDLKNENEILHEECQRLQLRLAENGAINGSKKREEMGRLQQTIESLTCQNTQLQVEAKALVEGSNALEKEKERMVETWQNAERDANDAQRECAKLKKELEASRNALAEAKRSKSMTEGQLFDLRRHNNLLEEKVSEGISKSTATLVEMQFKLDKRNDENKELQAKLEDLSLRFDAKSKACSVLMTKKAQLEERLKRPPVLHQEVQTDPMFTTATEMPVQAEHLLHMKRPYALPKNTHPVSSDSILPLRTSHSFDSSEGNSLSDRLTRIRESAEKASLVREHKRDILRLQSEHAAQIAALQKDFDEEKARLSDDSHAELNQRIKELKRRLVTEYEKKLDELERKHKKELQRIREETDRQSATAMQSVEAAMAELAKTSSLLERETRKRHALEIQIGKLESEHASEKSLVAQEFEQEMHALEAVWQEDKNLLLTSVQTECHKIIEQARQRPLCTKPKSPRLFVTTTPQLSTTTRFFPPEVSPLSETIQESPTVSLSELSQSLLETEAMVQQVMRNGAI